MDFQSPSRNRNRVALIIVLRATMAVVDETLFRKGKMFSRNPLCLRSILSDTCRYWGTYVASCVSRKNEGHCGSILWL